MPKREITIWDVLFWIAMIVLIIYIIAKLLGVINTPEWLNLLPIITLAFAIGVFYQRLIVFMDRMDMRTSYFKKGINDIGEKIKIVDNISDQMNNIISSLSKHDKRLITLEKKQETFTKLLKVKR